MIMPNTCILVVVEAFAKVRTLRSSVCKAVPWRLRFLCPEQSVLYPAK